MEPVTFVVAGASLLATPGPTNTLLATSGAAVGVRRSMPLLAAELGGYVVSIVALRSLIGPVVAAIPAFGTALRAAVVAYLLYLALRLWRRGAEAIGEESPVTFARVLITTLLNPKSIIFAFTILPQGGSTAILAPWLGALAGLITLIGGCWIAAGASLGKGLGHIVPTGMGYRVSAIVLMLLAGGVSAHAFR